MFHAGSGFSTRSVSHQPGVIFSCPFLSHSLKPSSDSAFFWGFSTPCLNAKKAVYSSLWFCGILHTILQLYLLPGCTAYLLSPVECELLKEGTDAFFLPPPPLTQYTEIVGT